jgi:hypothetical protein
VVCKKKEKNSLQTGMFVTQQWIKLAVYGSKPGASLD